MQNPVAMVFVGLALVFDGLLLVCLPAIPGSNLIPAWMAMIVILGITEEDGIALMVGTLISWAAGVAGVIAVIYSWETLIEWFHRVFT